MRLELFGVVLLELLASSWVVSLYSRSSGVRDWKLDLKGRNVKSLSQRNLDSRKSKREVLKKTHFCDQVTDGEITMMTTAVQETLRNISSLYSNAARLPPKTSRDERVRSFSEMDQCQQWISKMEEATEKISNQAELLQDKILSGSPGDNSDSSSESNLDIRQLEADLDVKTSELNSLAVKLETALNYKWNITLSRLIFVVQLLVEELNELKTEILGPIHQVKGKNFNLLVAQIRLGNFAMVNSFMENANAHAQANPNADALAIENYLLTSIIEEAYDGESLEYFLQTLAFATQVSPSMDETTFPALFKKVNGSSTSGHRSNPRVLLPLSYRIAESILTYKYFNLSVPAIVMETDKALEELIVIEILERWGWNIRSGDFNSILKFEQQGSEMELGGVKDFLSLLIKAAYHSSAENFQNTLNFVKALKSPRFRAFGLWELFAYWKVEGDHASQIAFQVKKLLDSPEIKGTEFEEEIRTTMTKIKAGLPDWERHAIWGGGNCHIQSYENDEYVYAPSDYYTRSNQKRELFTLTFKNKEDNHKIVEWTFVANPADEGRTFKIRSSWTDQSEMIISNGKDGVYLRNGIASFRDIPSESHSADWVIERIQRFNAWRFTIKNQQNGRYLYVGDMSLAWDADHPRVLAKSDPDPSSNEHVWDISCQVV